MSSKTFFSSVSIASRSQKCLRRQRLHDLLEQAIKGPALMVVAGAGFGKTQAVFCYLEDAPCVTTWLHCTDLDNITLRFWENMVNLVGLYSPGLAHEMALMGFPHTADTVSLFISRLRDAGAEGRRIVMVFDDLHLIHEKKVLHLIETIINACIPQLHVMLISRTEPQIDLTDLLVKGMVHSIGEEALRFTLDELSGYFDMRGVALSPQAVAKTFDITQGWIFAVRLLEFAIRQGAPHEEYAIEAMKLNIFKLMAHKFDTELSGEVQTFLVKLSLFQSLPNELVQRISAGNGQLIDDTLKLNAFVRYDSFANSYCIHQLFLDFLKCKHDILTPGDKSACYCCAGDWYALNGYRIDAIYCYGRAAEYDRMLGLVLLMPHSLPQGVAALLLDILDSVDERTYDRQPLLSILRARCLTQTDRLPQGLALLAALRRRYEAQPLTPESRSVLCEICMTQAVISHINCVYTNVLDFLDLCQKAHAYMPQGSALTSGRQSNHELGTYVCRMSSAKKADMDAYIDALTQAVPHITQVIHGYGYGLDDLARAELAYFKNQMKEAGSMAYSALCKAREKNQADIEGRALFYLMRIALSAGDYTKIKEVLSQQEAQASKVSSQRLQCDITASWFYAAIGCGDKVSGWLKRSYMDHPVGALASGRCNLTMVKYYMSDKRYDELLLLLDTSEYTADFSSFLFGKIALHAYRAVCLYQTGRQEAALEQLSLACSLARPGGLVMQFVEMGNDMVALAKFALKSEPRGIPLEWLRSIQRKASTYAKKCAYVATAYRGCSPSEGQPKLTKKEQELMTDLCHGLSIAEIASHRELSGSYVNNRLQAIYAKLGAQNAKDAIRIAALAELIK